ncbi:Hypothetical_protein [Hexamita inflata]|uniref:Hypothetical_protein n=1 Tax=Hexamita inflata TaxID=28002 RepID=A0AA86TT45_9EUKA|nr:Hypothetical protein HINF_LOCUS13442 [Hexamita inflata]
MKSIKVNYRFLVAKWQNTMISQNKNPVPTRKDSAVLIQESIKALSAQTIVNGFMKMYGSGDQLYMEKLITQNLLQPLENVVITQQQTVQQTPPDDFIDDEQEPEFIDEVFDIEL